MLRSIGVLVFSAFLFSFNSYCSPVEPVKCSSGDTPFPSGFWWGTATAAHQVEGGLDNEWTDWEPGHIANGDTSQIGIDHYNRFDEDLALAQAMGHNAHRLSIEWSRIEPRRGEYDRTAIEHYHQVFRSLRERGLRPLVTLHHFTNPKWIAAQGGWISRQTVRDFARFASFLGLEYGREVDDWITINEPNIYAIQSFFQGVWPPQHKNLQETLEVMANLARGHVAAYYALHAADRHSIDGQGVPCSVGIAHHISIFDPHSWWSPIDQVAAYLSDNLFNRSFLQAITSGKFDFWYPGALGVSERDPSGRSTLDFIGINYYTRWICRLWDRIPNPDPNVPKTAMGWEIYPEGIYRALKIANDFSRLPDGRTIPIVITENGMDDRWGDTRSSYLVQHLKYIAKAAQDGIPVKGYIHWTLIDNFEWDSGYAPHFGLYSVDRSAAGNLRRREKPSVEVFRRIAERNAIPKDLMDQYGGSCRK